MDNISFQVLIFVMFPEVRKAISSGLIFLRQQTDCKYQMLDGDL